MTLSGANAREVTAAKLTVTIYYRGWPVQRQTRDICGGPRPVTPPCPFECVSFDWDGSARPLLHCVFVVVVAGTGLRNSRLSPHTPLSTPPPTKHIPGLGTSPSPARTRCRCSRPSAPTRCACRRGTSAATASCASTCGSTWSRRRLRAKLAAAAAAVAVVALAVASGARVLIAAAAVVAAVATAAAAANGGNNTIISSSRRGRCALALGNNRSYHSRRPREMADSVHSYALFVQHRLDTELLQIHSTRCS